LDVDGEEAGSISETELLLLVVLLVLLPCCVCYVQYGIVSFLAGYRTRCPHCKETLKNCHAGLITVTLSSVPFGKETDSDAMAEFREQFRRDVCSALALTTAQVSVHAPDFSKGTCHATIHLASARAASTLERQIKEFDSDHLADSLNDQYSLPQPTTNVNVAAEDLVAAFCRQSSDPLSRLKRGKYTQFIVDVQPATVSRCNECKKHICSCRCPCCGHEKRGCPAVCQHYCDHCDAPIQICNSGDVEVILDLHRTAIPEGDQEMARHALRMEIADALAIHPLQASISSLRFGSIHFDVHFISCNDAAWVLGHPGFCVLSDHERLIDPMVKPLDSARRNGDFDTRNCRCPTRAQLVALFMQQCENKDSRLRQGKFFSATASATKYENEMSVLCRICELAKAWCQCRCQGCHRRLHACRVDCLGKHIDASAGAPAKTKQLSIECPPTLDVREDQRAGQGFSGPKILPTRAVPRAASSKVQTALVADLVTIHQSNIATGSTLRQATSQKWMYTIQQTSQQPEVDVYDSEWTKSHGQKHPRHQSPEAPPRSSRSATPRSATHKPSSQPHPPSETESRATEVGQVVRSPEDLQAPLLVPIELGKDAWESPSPVVIGQKVDSQSPVEAWTHTNSSALTPSVFVREENGEQDKRTVNTESPSVLNFSPLTVSVSQPAPHNVVSGLVTAASLVGLQISKDWPHSVSEVDDLVDVNSVPQGHPGYCNAEVRVGDLILEIDSQDVRNMPLAQLHQLLSGRLYSVVQITLQQQHSGDVYNVRVLRHRIHEFDSAAAKTRLPTFGEDSRREDACFAGLEVTEQPPHAVVAIDDLVDNRFVKQGDPGYSNPIVHVGDRILAVDGRPAEHVSVQELHGISLL